MSRNRAWRSHAGRSIAVATAVALSSGAAHGENEVARPNIVVLLADDLGWADVGCYGNSFHATPRIDRLCREGMRFTNAYASGPNCSPTRAALLSGRDPARTGVTNAILNQPLSGTPLREAQRKQALALDEVTVAEALRQAGYVTASIGKWHLGDPPNDPRAQGFAVSVGGGRWGKPGSYFYPFSRGAIEVPLNGKPGDYLTDNQTREALRFLRENHDRSFFLLLSYYAVHEPLGAKPELIAKYRQKAGAGERNPVYAAMVESLDASVGQVLDEIEALGLADRTFVVFTSDNGGLAAYTSMAPLRGEKDTLYEGGIRVPLVLRQPGLVPAGKVSDEPIITTDLYPTLLELSGASTTQKLDGLSLVPLLHGAAALGRDALYWHFPHYLPGRASPAGAIRSGRYKLIERFEDGKLELYDLSTDIGEQTDLAASKPELAADLQQKLAAWRKASGAAMPQPTPVHAATGSAAGMARHASPDDRM